MLSGPASVQVAALFYASYLFTGRWDHAQAVELADDRGNKLPRRSVPAAFSAYESWFERIQRLGLSEARRNAIDPLDGTGMHWR
jgi:hypothetical protein